MKVKKSNLALDVEWFSVIVNSSFFLVRDYFADRNDEVDVYHINLVKCYFDVFVDI